MEGDEREDRPEAAKADRVRRASKLAVEGLLGDPAVRVLAVPVEWDNQLAGEPRNLDTAAVEDEREALVAAQVVLGGIGEDHAPVLAEIDEERLERLELLLRFLDRDDVEARDDLGDQNERVEIALGRVAGGGAPLRGEPAELADVPGRDEQVSVALPGDFPGQLRPQATTLDSGIGRWEVGDCRHEIKA